MPLERFIPLDSINLSDSQSSSSRRCIAYLDDGKRCRYLIPKPDLATATSIRVQYDANTDDERESSLTKLAKLYLCSKAGHKTDENVKAAIQQWMQTEWPVDLRVARSASPSDSEVSGTNAPTDEDRVCKFSPSSQSRKALSDVTRTSRKLKETLEGIQKPTTNSNEGYIYITTAPAAPGFALIQRCSKGSDPLRNQKCYPGSQLHCCIRCPNAQLVEKLVLHELAVMSRVYKCEERSCQKNHTKWIEAAAERLEESVRAWAKLVEICYTDNTMLTAMKDNVPGEIYNFSQEKDRWLEWAKKTAESLKVISQPASSLPPSLPLRPAQKPSESSFISLATTTFSETPRPLTPCTPPDVRGEAVTPPGSAMSQAPDSFSLSAQTTDSVRGEHGSGVEPNAQREQNRSNGKRMSMKNFSWVKDLVRTSRKSL
ncbi:GIY-YIG nuclease family protein [Aspergillus foveolatus]|uniref:GIY-YIG nuclease family protein n=1 Tax=Aspergillus foveolatus TaxID=210207 RepID=UPI003CCE4BFA